MTKQEICNYSLSITPAKCHENLPHNYVKLDKKLHGKTGSRQLADLNLVSDV